MNKRSKPIVWLKGEVKTPPFSQEARIECGFLLWRLQLGEFLSLPHSRPMPSIGKNCHELRVRDKNINRRIVYRIDRDCVIIGDVFAKKTQRTPKEVIENCRKRFDDYDELVK